jgi:hypothetical protein
MFGFMLKLLALCSTATAAILCFAPADANAQNLTTAPMIFDVRRSLPLEPTEPRYHDFYINAGPEAGFRKGMFLTVVRLIPVHDPVQNKQQGTLSVNVARLQVIHVERNITVARLHSAFGNDERPTLEFEAVMIGDRIDPAAMTMEVPGQKKRAQETIQTPQGGATASTQSLTPAAAPAPGAESQISTPMAASAPFAAVPVGVPTASKNASTLSSTPDMVRAPITGVGPNAL